MGVEYFLALLLRLAKAGPDEKISNPPSNEMRSIFLACIFNNYFTECKSNRPEVATFPATALVLAVRLRSLSFTV